MRRSFVPTTTSFCGRWWSPEGPASLHLRVRPGVLEACAWGPGREWLLDVLPQHLGLDDRPPRFSDKLGRLQRQLPGVRRDDARMLELLEPHRGGQRFRVIHLLWAAGLHAPRFGPRIRGARP